VGASHAVVACGSGGTDGGWSVRTIDAVTPTFLNYESALIMRRREYFTRYQITSVAMILCMIKLHDKVACDLREKYCTRVFNFDIKKVSVTPEIHKIQPKNC
jgi:hypothetical protein